MVCSFDSLHLGLLSEGADRDKQHGGRFMNTWYAEGRNVSFAQPLERVRFLTAHFGLVDTETGSQGT